MIVSFSLQANSDSIIVNAPQATWRAEIKNIVAYEVREKSARIITVFGYDSDDLQNMSSHEWATRRARTNFVHPFDVTEFVPEFAVAFLDYYAVVAHLKIRRHPRLAYLIDRFDCNVEIKDYQTLPLTIQQEFEERLFRASLTRIRRLSINGRDITRKDAMRNRQQQVNAFRLMKWAVVLWMVILFAAGWFACSRLLLGQGRTAILFNLEGIASLTATVLLLIGWIYISFFLGELSALLILRRSMPTEVLKLALTEMGSPKRTTNWLAAKLLDQETS